MEQKKVYLVDDHLMQSSGIGLGADIEGKIISDAGFTYVKTSCKSEDDIIAQCADADVVLDLGTPIGPKTMDALKKCKAYLRYGIGFDVLDVDAASARGIMICNMPHYCIKEVATQTMTLMLACLRQLVHQALGTRSGAWYVKKPYPLHSTRFLTLGFMGFGNIARKTSEMAKPFGFRMIAFDPYVSNEIFTQYGVARADKDELLAAADIISMHTPLNKETFHLIDKPEFAKMKEGVIIVNTSRGGTVCNEALVEALQSGKVAAAGLDVNEDEPIRDANHPLLKMENAIITPHSAFDTVEATLHLREVVAETAVKILRGEPLDNVVNRKALGL